MADDIDPERADLIAKLCLEAGRIMEDESPALALVLPTTSDGISTRLAAIRSAAEDILALAAAAEALARRSAIS